MAEEPTAAELIAEGDAVPTAGWDFSWFDGRATEERPRWGYSRLIAERLRQARSALDVQTGGGEVLAEALRTGETRTGGHCPAVLAATESWPPNLDIAREDPRDDVTTAFRTQHRTYSFGSLNGSGVYTGEFFEAAIQALHLFHGLRRERLGSALPHPRPQAGTLTARQASLNAADRSVAPP